MLFVFKLVLGYYGNKHLGYVVNPMAITIHQLPFLASLLNSAYHFHTLYMVL